MTGEEIGLLAVCFFAQYQVEGTPWAVPRRWLEVGQVADELNIRREVADRIFDRWDDLGWLDGKFQAPRRCGLSAAGNRAAQGILNWRPAYGNRPRISEG